ADVGARTRMGRLGIRQPPGKKLGLASITKTYDAAEDRDPRGGRIVARETVRALRMNVLGAAGGASLFGRNGYAACAWSERDRGGQCRKKGAASVAARPTREAQWESILRAFIQPHKFTFVMNKLHDRPISCPEAARKRPGAECRVPRAKALKPGSRAEYET